MADRWILSQARRGLGMTQAAVAAASGISVPTLRSLERGVGTIRSLAAVLPVLGLRWSWPEGEETPHQGLARLRRAAGLSQVALAELVGCNRITILALERDLTGNISTLVRVTQELGIRQLVQPIQAPKSKRLIPQTNAPERDVVLTPPDLAAVVIAHFAPQMRGRVLDPAKGEGAFYDALPGHLDRYWCEVSEGRDFFEWREPVDWIITNPPWSKLRAFTRHAMGASDNIVWLVHMPNITTKARLRDLEQHGFGVAELVWIDTPRDWPQSGFQLVAAHLKRGYSGPWKQCRLDGQATVCEPVLEEN